MARLVTHAVHNGCPQRSNPIYRFFAPFRVPLWVALCILGIYSVVPDQTFKDLWHVPKLADRIDIVYFLIATLAFGIGGLLGAAGVRLRETSRSNRSTILRVVPQWYLRAGLMASLLGYVIWLGLTVYRAGGPAELLALRTSDPWYVENVLMQTIPGITTFTQVAVTAIPLWVVYGRRGRIERVLVWLLVFLAAGRSYLYSERLALLEVVLPSLFLLLSNRKLTTRRATAWLLVVFLTGFLFFTLSELSRSFLTRGVGDEREFLLAGFYRFLGYYLTSVNNAIFLCHSQPFGYPLYHTFVWVWRFPGLQGLYERLTGITMPHFPSLLASSGLNPEFNTISAIGAWIADFGHVAALGWASFIGVIAGYLWRMAPQDRILAALYGVWIVGELELMRIPYLTGTRLFPAYLFLLGALILRSAAPLLSRRDAC